MAEAVVSFAVERLGDLLISEAKFLYGGVSDQIREIQSQLRQMQSFLKDADKKRGNAQVGKWVAEIREIALQSEDVLETFAVRVASNRGGGDIKKIMRRFACIMCECISLHKIDSEIASILANIEKLASSRQNFNIQALADEGESSNSESERQRWLRMSYAHLIEKDFVGMENEIHQLVSYLKNQERGCEVISVWGMGGQGKTTLVNKVYNRTDVRSYFEASAWVCITQKFERRTVLQDILKGLLPTMKEEIMGMGDTELVEKLYKTQQEKKCLIVVDDIWSLTDWKMLKPAFPVGETIGSKILLTTRNEEVAITGVLYKLRCLTEEEGWNLLIKKAFPIREYVAEDGLEPKREKIGRDIVQQCQGHPLAISTLGGLLKGKTTLSEWEKVKTDIGSNLSRGDKTVRDILALSYDDLPIRLKQLFLYLGNFKEDEEIKTEELYLLWIGEGMVSSSQQAKGEILMDVAERYLVELAQRSLVQLEPMDELQPSDYYGDLRPKYLKFNACRLHDLIRDLCLSKGKEDDIIHVIDFQETRNESSLFLSAVGTQACRLAIYLYNDDDADNLVPLEKEHVVRQLRSMLFFVYEYREIPLKVQNLKAFMLVRVLKLDRFKFRNRKLPPGIDEVIHLRYLSLYHCELDELPSCIGKLRYLQTLDLRVSFRVDEFIIPNVLWKLKQLKHLYLPDCISTGTLAKKLRLDGLTELELLWRFDGKQCDANDLMKLTNLKVLLAIVWSLEEQEGVMNFVTSDKHHPRFTILVTSGISNNLIQLLKCNSLNVLGIYEAGTCDLPKEYDDHFSQSRLTMIGLGNHEFEEDPMVLLGKLPNLETLELRENSFVGIKEIVCSAFSFPRLKFLSLSNLHGLEKWRVDEGGMTRLFFLKIWKCLELEMLPEGLKFLTSLRELEIWHMPDAFNDRIRGIDGVQGQDFHKIRHIDSVTINAEEVHQLKH